MKRIVIREANLYEYDEIRAFYEKNPDPHVMPRPEDVMKLAIADGVFLIGLDTDILVDGERIFAVSSVYNVPARDRGKAPMLLKEAGGSLVNQKYRGYSVHKVLHCARILHMFILDRGGFDQYFGAIVCPNPASVSNIEKAGFVPWSDPPESLVADRAPFAKEGQTIQFYRFPEASLQKTAADLLTFANRGRLSRDNNDGQFEECQLVLDLQLLKWYRPILEKLAVGDLSALK